MAVGLRLLHLHTELRVRTSRLHLSLHLFLPLYATPLYTKYDTTNLSTILFIAPSLSALSHTLPNHVMRSQPCLSTHPHTPSPILNAVSTHPFKVPHTRPIPAPLPPGDPLAHVSYLDYVTNPNPNHYIIKTLPSHLYVRMNECMNHHHHACRGLSINGLGPVLQTTATRTRASSRPSEHRCK